jgi:hypothetical protein
MSHLKPTGNVLHTFLANLRIVFASFHVVLEYHCWIASPTFADSASEKQFP